MKNRKLAILMFGGFVIRIRDVREKDDT